MADPNKPWSLTERGEQIVALRDIAKWSWRKIADHIGASRSGVRERYAASKRKTALSKEGGGRRTGSAEAPNDPQQGD